MPGQAEMLCELMRMPDVPSLLDALSLKDPQTERLVSLFLSLLRAIKLGQSKPAALRPVQPQPQPQPVRPQPQPLSKQQRSVKHYEQRMRRKEAKAKAAAHVQAKVDAAAKAQAAAAAAAAVAPAEVDAAAQATAPVAAKAGAAAAQATPVAPESPALSKTETPACSVAETPAPPRVETRLPEVETSTGPSKLEPPPQEETSTKKTSRLARKKPPPPPPAPPPPPPPLPPDPEQELRKQRREQWHEKQRHAGFRCPGCGRPNVCKVCGITTLCDGCLWANDGDDEGLSCGCVEWDPSKPVPEIPPDAILEVQGLNWGCTWKACPDCGVSGPHYNMERPAQRGVFEYSQAKCIQPACFDAAYWQQRVGPFSDDDD